MKSLILIFVILFSLVTKPVKSQEDTYKIIPQNDQVSEKVNTYKKALDNADFDKYRLLDARRLLNFKNGFQLELLSARELKEKGIKYEENKIIKKDVPLLHKSTFKILDSGQIVEQSYNTKIKQKNTKARNKSHGQNNSNK